MPKIPRDDSAREKRMEHWQGQRPKQTEAEKQAEKQAELFAETVKAGNVDCTICMEPFDKEELLEKLTNCNHIFHKNCINRNIITAVVGNQKPVCPICRTEISNKQINDARKQNKPLENRLKLEAAAQAAAQLAAEQAEIAADYDDEEEEPGQVMTTPNETILGEVIDNEHDSESAVPFFGVVLCTNNQERIIKYLNAKNFDLGTANTLGQLKNAILAKEPEILQSMPQGFGCTIRNIASMFTSRIQPVTRRIQIGPINFTTPSTCAIDGLIMPRNYDDNTLLETIYLDYLNAAETFLSSAERRSLNYNLVKDVYSFYHPPSEEQTYLNDFNPYQPPSYYRNLENPIIPLNFRAEFSARERDPYGTKAPIAWLAFQIECINSGGKSRKSKKCRKSKKYKKSRKSKK
jgi:hypothetical protein